MASIERVQRIRYKGVQPRPCPVDFDETFVAIGRLDCEEHYRVGRGVIDHWLAERGKARLIAARIAFVRQVREERPRRRCPADFKLAYVHLGPMGCLKRYQAGWTTLNRWLDECGADELRKAREHYMRGYTGPKVSRVDMGRALSRAFPVERNRN
jgi:hypothetical protein